MKILKAALVASFPGLAMLAGAVSLCAGCFCIHRSVGLFAVGVAAIVFSFALNRKQTGA